MKVYDESGQPVQGDRAGDIQTTDEQRRQAELEREEKRRAEAAANGEAA